jgi:hypothetical protein
VVAVSLGAVFFGAMTYIGNGPNLMVKAICDHAKVRTPSFFGYLLVTACRFSSRYWAWLGGSFSADNLRLVEIRHSDPGMARFNHGPGGLEVVVGSFPLWNRSQAVHGTPVAKGRRASVRTRPRPGSEAEEKPTTTIT